MSRFGKAFVVGCVGVLFAGASVCLGASGLPVPPKSVKPFTLKNEAPPSMKEEAPAATPEEPPEQPAATPEEPKESPGEPATKAAPAPRENTAGRYSVILVRNPFGLNPPPPPLPPEPEAPPEPEVDIKLTGMTTLLGQQRAFLKTIDPTKKEDAEKYYSLKVGEAKDGLEIVSIDMDLGKVTIRHKDIEKELDMKVDGLKAKVAASTAKLTPAQKILEARKRQQAALLAARQRRLPPGTGPSAAAKAASTSRTPVTPTSMPTATRRPNGYNQQSRSRPPAISGPANRNVQANGNGAVQLPIVNRSNLPLTRSMRSNNNSPLLPPPPPVDPKAQAWRMEVNAAVSPGGPDGLPPLPPTGLTDQQ